MSEPHRMRLRNGIRTVNGITGETEPTYGEYVLADDYDALRSRLAEAEAERALIIQRAENAEAALVESDALLREMLAWKVAIECIAPELGGAIMTLARIDAHLARKP